MASGSDKQEDTSSQEYSGMYIHILTLCVDDGNNYGAVSKHKRFHEYWLLF